MIIDSIKSLNLPSEEFIVIGSGIMDALGIRPAGDIDLLVSHQLYQQLKHQGWSEYHLDNGVAKLKDAQDEVEVWLSWSGRDYSDWLVDTTKINGIAFVTLPQLKQWKALRASDKDIRDIQLIDQYTAAQNQSTS